MKRFALLMAAAALIGFTSCGDDDPKETPNYGSEVVGTYSGYTKANNGTIINNLLTDGAKTTITANQNGTVDVKSVCTQWGTYALENLTVARKDGVYTFAGAGQTSVERGDTSYDCPFTMSGSIKSETDAVITCVVTMPAPMNGVTVEFITGALPQ